MQDQPNPNQISARELYNGCISEDQKIYESSYKTLRIYVYSSARYLVDNNEDAEDLTQNTLVKVLNRIEKLETADAFKGWVQTILHNEYIDRIRKNRNHDSLEERSDLADESTFADVETSDEPLEQLFNASQGKKTKWAWIGRYHYGLQDRDLACVENLLCEKSVQDSTVFVARAKTKAHWIETKLVDLLLEAKFRPIDPADTDPILQKYFQQILIAKSWHLLYEASLDKGTRWAWIGRNIYEMSDTDLVRVENLLCNSSLGESIMSIRRTKSRNDLTEYLSALEASEKL